MLFAMAAGIFVALNTVVPSEKIPEALHFLQIRHTHNDSEVHVHADFLMYIHDNRIRFTDSKYQSNTQFVHHPSLHFHDNNDTVIHRHAANVTLSDFFMSIGYVLSDTCIITDTNAQFCNNDQEKVAVFVNGVLLRNITEYVFTDNDRILVYYGDLNNPRITEYQNAISNDACIYSGTCPERGVPPPESCGLTCEVVDFLKK